MENGIIKSLYKICLVERCQTYMMNMPPPWNMDSSNVLTTEVKGVMVNIYYSKGQKVDMDWVNDFPIFERTVYIKVNLEEREIEDYLNKHCPGFSKGAAGYITPNNPRRSIKKTSVCPRSVVRPVVEDLTDPFPGFVGRGFVPCSLEGLSCQRSCPIDNIHYQPTEDVYFQDSFVKTIYP
ncbi:MAG: hypothetical protein ACI88L_000045 [Candidatus Paceibacteria bacterium]|jgi:hypothetical protein